MPEKREMENMSNLYNSASEYLSAYYESFPQGTFRFGLSYCKRISSECLKISAEEKITGYDLSNAVIACFFRYASMTKIIPVVDSGMKLLDDFTHQISYPQEQVESIHYLIGQYNSGSQPQNNVERVLWDALDSRLAVISLPMQLRYLKQENNDLNQEKEDGLGLLNQLKKEFSREYYYTDYAKKSYLPEFVRYQNKIVKRIQRLSENQLTAKKEKSEVMSDRETEDLFKIAFRNYVKLVDVADTKAGLLIQVNAILISVVIGFVVSRTDKYPMLLAPSFLILAVSFLTILLSILASRPQRNVYMQDKSSKSYQTFFFGSFDLISSEFKDADFDTYARELTNLLKGGKANIYNEIYKEVFNVRIVLSKKFTYLSYAYLVFLGGLALSIIAFFMATK